MKPQYWIGRRSVNMASGSFGEAQQEGAFLSRQLNLQSFIFKGL